MEFTRNWWAGQSSDWWDKFPNRRQRAEFSWQGHRSDWNDTDWSVGWNNPWTNWQETQPSFGVSVAKPDSSQEAQRTTANSRSSNHVGWRQSPQQGTQQVCVSVSVAKPDASEETQSASTFESSAATHEAGSMPAQASSAPISVVKPDSSQVALPRPALQCPACKRVLCQTSELCWLHRANKQNGVEVHLTLRPELPMPQTLVRATEAKQGVAQSWKCECGTDIGDSRAVGPRHGMMTAFKSSKVILYGQHYLRTKSMWPSTFNTPPFNNIEVRTPNTFHGVPSGPIGSDKKPGILPSDRPADFGEYATLNDGDYEMLEYQRRRCTG
jgi:hypothetical protein